ncbi:MAG: DUF1127 domain-containing protein [Chromatiales bacterium]|jgi:uncharacterized protein YjiS (DUF1127 family)|nr:DUF1127 domain-containing protein [Chromatiales bacterium]
MLRHTVGSIIASLARGRVRRQTIRELSALSDRQLADIGILRADIGKLVNHRISVFEARSSTPVVEHLPAALTVVDSPEAAVTELPRPLAQAA